MQPSSATGTSDDGLIGVSGWDTSQMVSARHAAQGQLEGCLAAISEVLSQLQELRQDMFDRFESQSQEFQRLHEGLRHRPSPSGSSRRLREEKIQESQAVPGPQCGGGFTAASVHGLAEAVQKQLLSAVASQPQELEPAEPVPPSLSLSASAQPPHPFGVLPEPGPEAAPPRPRKAFQPSPSQQPPRERPPNSVVSDKGEAPLALSNPEQTPVQAFLSGGAISEGVLSDPRQSPAPARSNSGASHGQQAPKRAQSFLGPASAGGISGAGRGSVDALRRRVEQEIVQRNMTADKTAGAERMASVPETINASEPRKRPILEGVATGLDHINLLALKLGGVLPWSPARFRASLLYQWVILLLHAAITAYFVVQAQSSFKGERHSLFLWGDLVLTFGGLGALLAVRAFAGSGPLEQSLRQLEAAVVAQGFKARVSATTAFDTLATLGVWLAFLSDRLGSLYALSGRDLPTEDLVHYVGVVVSSGQLAILVLAALRLTRHMAGLVDAFASGFCATLDVPKAIGNWNVLQASIRMASSAIEWCFAVLLSTLVLQALAIVFDLRALMSSAWALTASGLLILGLTQILLQAAAVTDACIRVPQLVNSTPITDEALDEERMYLVDYITASAAGFYIFNVRLGAGIGIKVLHYTGLMAFTIARVVLPSTGSV